MDFMFHNTTQISTSKEKKQLINGRHRFVGISLITNYNSLDLQFNYSDYN